MSDEVELACPLCKSVNVQSVPMAYESGVTDTAGGATTIGGMAPLGNLPAAGVFGAFSQFSARSSTMIATRVSPPRKRDLSPVHLMGLAKAFCILFGIISLMVATGEKSVFGLIWVGLSAWGFMAAKKKADELRHAIDDYNNRIYPNLHDEWRKAWMCRRCGWIGAMESKTPKP